MANAQAPSPESLRLELQEAITTFRHQNTQLFQALGVIVTADALLLGYGFSQRLSSVLLVASAMPLAALSAYITIMSTLVPVCYVAKRLEHKLSLQDAPLIGTWAKIRRDLTRALSDFEDLEDLETRKRLSVPPWHFLWNTASLSLLAIFALQIGLVAISFFGYHFHFM